MDDRYAELQAASDEDLEAVLSSFFNDFNALGKKDSRARSSRILHKVVAYSLASSRATPSNSSTDDATNVTNASADGWEQLRLLSQQPRAKCRCDAVWYGDTIAYGCKTCGLSSASCICVNCFDLSEHEGHEFYISRSDYGCCDCGDPFAWKPSGFCSRHPGPSSAVNPRDFIDQTLLHRIRVVVRQFVRELVNCRPGLWEGLQLVRPKELTSGRVPDNAILVTGLNLRVSEDTLREVIEENLMAYALFPGRPHLPEVNIICEKETKGSRGRGFIVFKDSTTHATAAVRFREKPCVLKGSPLNFYSNSAEVIEAVLDQVEFWEEFIELLLSLGKFHDGLRREIGEAFQLKGNDGEVYAAKFLKLSHLMEPGVRKLETNLFVDLMLDLHFKHAFARIFTGLYQVLVLSRRGAQDMSELGDFTCQMFTRTDVTLELVEKHGLVNNLLECAWQLLKPAIMLSACGEVLDANSNLFRAHEIVQCSMDLLYVLDHTPVAKLLVTDARLREELWSGWMQILIVTQNMNSHTRRGQRLGHVEYENQAWGSALTFHTDLVANTFLILDALPQGGAEAALNLAQMTWVVLNKWLVGVSQAERWDGCDIPYITSQQPVSFHIPLNRILAALVHEVACACPEQSIRESLAQVGLSETDVVRWMEHPLRTIVLHSQVMTGMWKRNGESVENENEFYRMNYWHHLLLDLDYLSLRLAALSVPSSIFFPQVMQRFELTPTLRPVPNDAESQEWHMPKMQALVLLMVQLLAPMSPLSLKFPQHVVHTTCQVLAHGPKAHSQLWDPRLERSSASATSKDNKVLDYAKQSLASFDNLDGEHSPAKYHLKECHWVNVDPSFPLFSWSEQQVTEEHLSNHLKSKGKTMCDWALDENYNPSPPFPCYQSFYAFARAKELQALCWLTLSRLVCKPDGRLASFGLQLALRLLRHVPRLDEAQDGSQQNNLKTPILSPSTVLAPLSIDALVPFMADHFMDTVHIVFETPTVELVLNHADLRDVRSNPEDSDAATLQEIPTTTILSLTDVLETLHADESLGPSRFLAQAVLKLCAPSAPTTTSASPPRPAPWFKKTVPEHDDNTNTAGCPSPTGEQAGRRSSQKLNQARLRQQALLQRLRKRQEQFIQHNSEEHGGAQDEPSECVICFLDTPEEDLGYIAYLRAGPSFASARTQVQPAPSKNTSSSSSSTAVPPRFKLEGHAKAGMVMVRSCGHRLHYSCWRRFRPAALERSARGCQCPYCGQPSNAWLVDFGAGDEDVRQSPAHGDSDKSRGNSVAWDVPLPKSPAAAMDFLGALHQHSRRCSPDMGLIRLLADNISLSAVQNSICANRPQKESRSSLCASNASLARNTDIKRSIVSLIRYLHHLDSVRDGNDALDDQMLAGDDRGRDTPSTGSRQTDIDTSPHIRSAIHEDPATASGGVAARNEDRFANLVRDVITKQDRSEVNQCITKAYRAEVAILSRIGVGLPAVQMGLATWLAQVHHLLQLLLDVDTSVFEELKMLASVSGSMSVEEGIAMAHRILTEELQLPEVTVELCATVEKQLLEEGPLPAFSHSLCMIYTGDERPGELPPEAWHMKEDEAVNFIRNTAPLCLNIPVPRMSNTEATLRVMEYVPTVFPPIAASRVYQKFYTTFVKVSCEFCGKVPAIATVCLNCGELMCCNSQCCRRLLGPDEFQWHETGGGATGVSRHVGEVTYHSKVCGYGICVFLQLSNSLVHVVMDGFIACWGSLYLDHYGEEDYQLARPLTLSEARLSQLTQQIREVSFDFENRLKWKHVTFV
eukprot:GEMP01000816.1.p1 GENE.GEMP01000816.1~~GEMP01000816.1.p1  ORF type:complete len:1774 (+),score=346.40 GEMP01000816.1:117-5438(+)